MWSICACVQAMPALQAMFVDGLDILSESSPGSMQMAFRVVSQQDAGMLLKGGYSKFFDDHKICRTTCVSGWAC